MAALKHVLVWGLGLSGRSAVIWFLAKGYKVSVYEEFWTHDKHEFASKMLGASYTDIVLSYDFIKQIDYVLVSPGVSVWHEKYRWLKRCGVNIRTDIDLFLENYSGRTIGITGTNGKSTLTALLAHMANKNNTSAQAIGNIGRPCLEALTDSPELAVVEVSSFYLAHGLSKKFDLGIFINIAPDHLNWHRSYVHYKFCKYSLAKYSNEYIDLLSSRDAYGQSLGEGFDLVHYISNKYVWHDICTKSFAKLPHRLQEFEHIGLTWVNDSKSTNAHSTLYACRNYQENNLVLILAGQSKGWQNDMLPANVRQIIIIGQANTWSLQTEIHMHQVNDLTSAVHLARELAQGCMVVLFSPGGASFDQFDNFQHRGQSFMEQVQCLN